MLGFRRRASLEKQVRTLARHGITLLPGRTIDDLLESFDREDYESEPFLLLLVAMGQEIDETRPGEWFSDSVWCDLGEPALNDGDFLRIAERMAAVSGGELPLTGLRDHVDAVANEAWLAFSLNGEAHRYDSPDVRSTGGDDVFALLVRLLREHGSKKRFYVVQTGGPEIVIGCATPVQLKGLQRATGLRVGWLEG